LGFGDCQSGFPRILGGKEVDVLEYEVGGG
jgi:hypothetical protein